MPNRPPKSDPDRPRQKALRLPSAKTAEAGVRKTRVEYLTRTPDNAPTKLPLTPAERDDLAAAADELPRRRRPMAGNDSPARAKPTLCPPLADSLIYKLHTLERKMHAANMDVVAFKMAGGHYFDCPLWLRHGAVAARRRQIHAQNEWIKTKYDAIGRMFNVLCNRKRKGQNTDELYKAAAAAIGSAVAAVRSEVADQ